MSLDELRLNYNMNCFICYQSNVFLHLDASSLFSNKVHICSFLMRKLIRLELFWSNLWINHSLHSAQAWILNFCKIAETNSEKAGFKTLDSPSPSPSDIQSHTKNFLCSWNYISTNLEFGSSHETRHTAVQGLRLTVLRLLQARGQALSLAFKFYEFAQKRWETETVLYTRSLICAAYRPSFGPEL